MDNLYIGYKYLFMPLGVFVNHVYIGLLLLGLIYAGRNDRVSEYSVSCRCASIAKTVHGFSRAVIQ